MKLSSLFKSQKKPSFSPLLCRLPHCGNPKTLSFRLENNHKIFNSQRFSNNIYDCMVDKVIEGLKIEKERFFFDARDKNVSILEVLSLATSNNNNNSNELEHYQPFNDSCDLKLSSRVDDPYGDFMKTMVEMIESNRENKDWEESIEEIAYWLVENNEKDLHKHIFAAFCGLWNIYSSYPSRAMTERAFKNSPFSFSTNNPPSPHFLSLIEPKAEDIYKYIFNDDNATSNVSS